MSRVLACCLLVLSFLALSAHAQEKLSTILDRGYVAHWLVCGPFPADAEGGILAAVARGGAPLADHDFMAPIGGIARMEPEHLKLVETPAGKALWQRAGTQDTSLDLAPFFPEASEGIACAAFEAVADKRQTVLFDVQSALGARVWFNGFPVRDVSAAPISATGADRFAVAFRPGKNLLVMELPGATFEALARVAKMPVRELLARGFANRPLLKKSSGFEVALALHPALAVGNLLYVPRLENTGGFSGARDDVRQDTELTLFNPTDRPSQPVDISVQAPGAETPVARHIRAIPPQSDWREGIAIPTGDALPGQGILVRVTIQTEDLDADFRTTVQVLKRSAEGKVYFVTGQRHTPETPEDQRTEFLRQIDMVARQAVLAEQEWDYGFDLGHTIHWQAALTANPGLRETLLDSVGRARCGARAGYAPVDERLVDGETLLRNVAMGLTAAEYRLRDLRPSYDAWGLPGIAPQTPQILAMGNLPGLDGNVLAAGVPPLFRQLAPGGQTVWYRRREPAIGPSTLAELRNLVSLQRRELLSLGVDVDLVINDSIVPPPEPFFLGAAAKLEAAYPAVYLRGGGARDFFDDLGYLPDEARSNLTTSGRLLTRGEPGALLAQPWLKEAHHLVERRVLLAERFATFAGLWGAAYPEAALDHAWRQLLYWGTPDTLGIARESHTFVDALAGLRWAAESADYVLRDAAVFIAGKLNTLDTAPRPADGVQALVVFNPSGAWRDGVCTAELSFEDAPGISLQELDGRPVPFLVERLDASGATAIRSARIRFVAKDIPPLGYQTFHVLPTGALPTVSERKDLQIENDQWLVSVDPATGDVNQLLDKRAGTDFVRGPANRLVALEEDPARTNGGRDIWTTNTRIEPDAPVSEVRTRVTSWMQELQVTTPFAGGTLTRMLTVYDGLPEIYCETTVDAPAVDHHVVALSFASPAAARTPVYGERFAAITARTCATPEDIRTEGVDNLSETALQPALEWASFGPSDAIRTGQTGVVPFMPANIVYGPDPDLRNAAERLQQAFLARGVPASLRADAVPARDAVWSDSTDFVDIRDDLRQGRCMRILLGSPEQNALCADLMSQAPPDLAALLAERLPYGATLLLDDFDAPEGVPAGRTLIFAALTPAQTADLALDMAAVLRARGVFSLPESAFPDSTAEPEAETGLAVFFPGTRACATSAEGRMLLAWSRQERGPQDAATNLPPPAQTLRYAIRPYEGTWRDAQLPQAARAYNEALFAIAAPLGDGAQPPAQSFLDVGAEGLVVSAVKPAGYGAATGSTVRVAPANGVVVRGWESTGQAWTGLIRPGFALSGAMATQLREEPGQDLSVANQGIRRDLGPFEIASFWLLPDPEPLRDVPAAIGPGPYPHGPLHTRYWLHNTGPAPAGGMPLGLLLRGELGEGENTVQVIVTNHSINETIAGTVQLSASSGWSLGPDTLDYRLAPGQSARDRVVVLRTSGESASGGVSATTEYGGQVYRDVLEALPDPLSMEVRRNGNQIRVTVRNKSGIPAEGFLDLVTPPGFWPELGRPAPANALPRRAAVSVPAYRDQDVLFRVSGDGALPWAVAKLGANGHVVYAPVPPAE